MEKCFCWIQSFNDDNWDECTVGKILLRYVYWYINNNNKGKCKCKYVARRVSNFYVVSACRSFVVSIYSGVKYQSISIQIWFLYDIIYVMSCGLYTNYLSRYWVHILFVWPRTVVCAVLVRDRIRLLLATCLTRYVAWQCLCDKARLLY